ncbi:protein FRA10AC1 [Biomphalaria pfeifferi]|uniref:Protein FRA10AC1 n=1 Tax=Biomphalaria pfeifferi TaxID=112525 RepID=A0AAD8EWH7_BIOPF|nr:protein FRA10AC1 [Biomphalaria pfeifferi]
MAEWIDFSEVPKEREYDSAFESDAEVTARKQNLTNLLHGKKKHDKIANKRQLEEELIKEEGKAYRSKAVALDAYSRHKEFINNYLLYYGGSMKEFKRDTSKDKTDADVIRENHQFLWDETDNSLSWEKKLAKRYYDKLFKEYCIADLSRYKENKIGMRWRTEKEVIEGKGQFTCGNKKCNENEEGGGLKSWEVNFGYLESGVKRNALVKLRLCPDCSYKLNYRKKHKDVSRKKEVHRSDDIKKSRLDEAGPSDGYTEKTEDAKVTKTEEVSTSKDIWSQPVVLTEDKSREDEFDSYFKDMFL